MRMVEMPKIYLSLSKRLKLSSLILSLVVFLLLFSTPLTAESWNILVYMAADNNLYQSALEDLNSMESVDLPPGVKVTVQTDFPSDHSLAGGSRWQIRKDNSTQFTSPLLQDLGTINSGDPDVLNDFIRWGLQRYSAERTMLVIWSHGDSWFKDASSKWICPDDDAQDVLSVTNGDLKRAFAGMSKLDILLFDACSMQSIEVLTELQYAAQYIIGSEDLVPVKGFPYQSILPLFNQTLPQILDAIPGLYTGSYDAFGSQNPNSIGFPTTCSVVRTSDLPAFNRQLREFSVRFQHYAPELMKLYPYLYGMNYGYCEVDLLELFGKIVLAPLPDVLIGSAQALLNTWNNAVISYSALNYEHALGTATIWFPWDRSYFDYWWRIYHNLDFASTRWLTLLNQAYGEDSQAPLPVSDYFSSVSLSTLQIEFTQPPDPDSLHYEISVQSGSAHGVYSFYPRYNENPVRFGAQVTGAGSFSIVAIDPAGNRSAAVNASFNFAEPDEILIPCPNPVRSRSLASLRWYLEGEHSITLELYNLRGQQVISQELGTHPGGEGNFLLSSIPSFRKLNSGIYIVKLRYGSRSLRAKILLK